MAPPSVQRLTHVVSPLIWSLILDSSRLRRAIVPEGLAISPYEILGYEATLVVHDEKGRRATFQRTQKIRFLQQGVSAILDHAWGDGVVITNYRHSAGALEESFRDEGRRHFVVGLKRATERNDVLTFRVEREIMAGFTGEEEWFDTTIDHPVKGLGVRVIFPRLRPPRRAALDVGDGRVPLPLRQLHDGRAVVGFKTRHAHGHIPYVIRWSW